MQRCMLSYGQIERSLHDHADIREAFTAKKATSESFEGMTCQHCAGTPEQAAREAGYKPQ